MARSYYSNKVNIFLHENENEILGKLSRNNEFSLEENQKASWISQIRILKDQLSIFTEGHIIFEYTIPRIGKRIDNVLIYKDIVFLLEFKVGDNVYHNYAVDQVMDYALDLKNFHKESHNKIIVPMLIVTKADYFKNSITLYPDGIIKPLLCNSKNILETIEKVCEQYQAESFCAALWENLIYMPTPTIIEAAQALYNGHNVKEISRSDSGAINLNATTQAINKIINYSKSHKEKSICFITGVPGGR